MNLELFLATKNDAKCVRDNVWSVIKIGLGGKIQMKLQSLLTVFHNPIRASGNFLIFSFFLSLAKPYFVLEIWREIFSYFFNVSVALLVGTLYKRE